MVNHSINANQIQLLRFEVVKKAIKKELFYFSNLKYSYKQNYVIEVIKNILTPK